MLSLGTVENTASDACKSGFTGRRAVCIATSLSTCLAATSDAPQYKQTLQSSLLLENTATSSASIPRSTTPLHQPLCTTVRASIHPTSYSVAQVSRDLKEDIPTKELLDATLHPLSLSHCKPYSHGRRPPHQGQLLRHQHSSERNTDPTSRSARLLTRQASPPHLAASRVG